MWLSCMNEATWTCGVRGGVLPGHDVGGRRVLADELQLLRVQVPVLLPVPVLRPVVVQPEVRATG